MPHIIGILSINFQLWWMKKAGEFILKAKKLQTDAEFHMRPLVLLYLIFFLKRASKYVNFKNS